VDPRLRSVARVSVRTVNSPLAKRRFNRALDKFPRPVKLEVGGVKKREGWLVTNVNATARHYMDATQTWPFEPGEVSHMYADNVIEHITLAAGRSMLAEAFRCLRPGGVIRLVTPDIRTHVEIYLSGANPTDSDAGKSYAALGEILEHPIDMVRIPIGSFGHHAGYVYDFETLAAELIRAGFNSPVRCVLGESEHSELAGLDRRSLEGGTQMAVEATR
jgi:hypothetical protein